MSAEQIKVLLDKGVQAREAGDYITGLQDIQRAFTDSIGLDDQSRIVESGNQLSIQLRLLAGRSSRSGNKDEATRFSNESLAVYNKLEELGLLNLQDPNIARNWAHSLLYAGKYEEAVRALEQSARIQTNQAAQGDEMCHLASAKLIQGDINGATDLVDKGTKLIQDNNGSNIWLTFGYMTLATLLAKKAEFTRTSAILREALVIAEENGLMVGEEEIKYLLTLPPAEVNVLKAVGI